MRYIVTEGEVRAILPGTLLVDIHGWPMTRTHEGEFAAWTPDQRWAFYSVDEITGAVPFGDASPFLPLSSPDEDPGESPAARGRAVLSEDADPEVWHRLARWELEGARWTWDPEVNNVVGLLVPGESNRAIAVVYADGEWEVDEERLFEDCSRAGCDQPTKPGDELCGYHRGDAGHAEDHR